MLSSKKILYFIIMSLLIVCYANGIDYRSNIFDVAETQTEIVDFSDSGFFAVSDVGESMSIVADNDEDGNAVSYEEAFSISVDPSASQPDDSTTASTIGSETDVFITTTSTGAQETTTQTNPLTPDTPTTATPITTTTTTTTTQNSEPDSYNTTTTYIAPTTTTTTTTTYIPPTTTTTEKIYYDSGNVSFVYSQVRIYAGASTTVSLSFPIGTQRYATFASKDTSIATVRSYDDTTVEITGSTVGSTWIQAKTSSGEYAYCKVIVTDFAGEVIRLTNIERSNNGLYALSQGGSQLQRMANIRLNETESYFSHTRPNGTRFYTVASDIGLTYRYIGENLAAGQTTPQQAVEEWMASPTHRANILNSNYTQLCVAYGIGSDGYTYWVQIFFDP